MRNFRELVIWQKAMSVAKDIYKLTNDFPANERYGLSSQIQRAAISIPSNIAEGCSRRSDADFARFLEMAQGSAFEVETQLLLANDFGYIKVDFFSSLIEEIHYLQRQINKLITIIRTKKQ